MNDAVSNTIDYLMLGEYLRRGHGVPRPSKTHTYPGGFKDIMVRGVVAPVCKADVESMYPSIITTAEITPASDHLGVFPLIVSGLLEQRLELKHAASDEDDPRRRAILTSRQQGLKLLLNACYGFLGNQWVRFNDSAAAARVTEIGRGLLRQMIVLVEQAGGTVIEVDMKRAPCPTQNTISTPTSSSACRH